MDNISENVYADFLGQEVIPDTYSSLQRGSSRVCQIILRLQYSQKNHQPSSQNTDKSTYIWNKKYLPIHYNVAWYIFSTMVALKPRGLTWQNHTPTHTFPVSTEMFFSHGHYLPQYLNIDDLQLSFSKEFRLSSVLMTFASFCLASEDDNKVQDFAKGKGAVAENGFFFHLGLRNLWAIANCHLMIIVQTDLNWSILSI